MGKILLLAVIIFAAYWAARFHKGSKEQEAEKKQPKQKSNVDELIAEHEAKIKHYSALVDDGIKEAEAKLEWYKKELEKLQTLKNK